MKIYFNVVTTLRVGSIVAMVRCCLLFKVYHTHHKTVDAVCWFWMVSALWQSCSSPWYYTTFTMYYPLLLLHCIIRKPNSSSFYSALCLVLQLKEASLITHDSVFPLSDKHFFTLRCLMTTKSIFLLGVSPFKTTYTAYRIHALGIDLLTYLVCKQFTSRVPVVVLQGDMKHSCTYDGSKTQT